MILTCDARGHCDYLSQQWTDYSGATRGTDVQSAWLERIHPEDLELLATEWLGAIASSTDLVCKFRIRRADGTYRWFAGRASPHKDERGLVTRWYGAANDIEEQKNAQEIQLRNRKMEALGTIAGGTACSQPMATPRLH